MEELWYGFKIKHFEFEGAEAVLVFPEKADKNGNFALKTEYFGAFPETEIALLKRGFHVAYLKNRTRFATRDDCDKKAAFVKYLHEKYGLRDKCVPIGMSCGGAHAVNFAGYYPDLVACMFIDAPVLNFCDYPGKFDKKECEGVWENEFVLAYPGIKRADLPGFDNHPIGKAHILKTQKIPIIMLYGTEDRTVNYDENGRLLEDYYEGSELLKIVPRRLQGHHPHGIPNDPSMIVDFILANV